MMAEPPFFESRGCFYGHRHAYSTPVAGSFGKDDGGNMKMPALCA
jgi:hypothetical protein